MSIPVNGTHAKETAIHFLERTQERYTPAIIRKTISQIKTVMSQGYERDEIIKVIDYLIDVKKVNLYSIGYINSAINDVLAEIKKIEYNNIPKERNDGANHSKEVSVDENSASRNRKKAEGFGSQSRFGKKHNFDMFEGHGED